MKYFVRSVVLLLAVISAAGAAEESDRNQARAAVKALGSTLQDALMTAMREGGPQAAIDVCHVEAMPLTRQVSEQTGWQVARTSLRLRNPDNAADEWEQAQLEKFAAQLAAGEPMASLDVLETQVRDGHKVQRYMKAIGMSGPCLTCHGQALSAPVESKLDALYPQDQARGYALGDLRGAFTLVREIP